MLITRNVLRHLGLQLATGAASALLAYLAGFNWSELGPYAAVAQGLVAVLTSVAHEAMGTAPVSK